MAEPATDYRDVHPGGYQMHSGCVAEAMRCDRLRTKRGHGFCCGRHIGSKFVPDPGGAERLAITVDEQPLVGNSGLSLEQFPEQQYRLGPERTDPLLPALAIELHTTRRLEP